jgi:hypothetical protein
MQMDKPQPLVKMTETFRRNAAVSAQADVARRVFYLAQDSIRVDYHIPEDRITHSYRIYTKTGHSHIVQSDPMRDKVDQITQLEQFQALLAAEKECSMVLSLAQERVGCLTPALVAVASRIPPA